MMKKQLSLAAALKRTTFVAILLLCAIPLFAAAGEQSEEARKFNSWFHDAAREFDVPVEVLQAVAYAESRWKHLVPEARSTASGDRRRNPEVAELSPGLLQETGEDHVHDETAPPPSYGVMGLRDDGHFGRSLVIAAALIGSTPDELRRDPQLNIRGAAALLSAYSGGLTGATPIEWWEDAVARYSGIPQPKIAEMHTYDIFRAINVGERSAAYRVDQRTVDLEQIYGSETLRILSAPRITLTLPSTPASNIGANSDDYGPALWTAASTCNYTAGRSTAVTHVAEHIMVGTYAGVISYFANCNDRKVSAHYCVRSSDGQVTQMVRERDTAHHVAYHNSYTVGIEHEGYPDNCAWYTTAMYNGSSALTRDIVDSHGISRDGTYDASLGWDTELDRYSKWKVKGHTNFPTTKSCPGACWDWPRFRSLVLGCTVGGAILDKYNSLGGAGGFLGSCTTNELTCPDGVGKFNHFQGGSIYWTPDTGAWSVRGAIKEKWGNLGWETGFLRYPITDERVTPDGVGRFNHFQGGSIYWTSNTGAQSIGGAIKTKWANLGWETGFLKYPTTDERKTPDGVGRFNHFQGGSIYWTPDTGAQSIGGAIKTKWANLGWETGFLKYPTTDERKTPDGVGRFNHFQGGSIYWTSGTGAWSVQGAIRSKWASMGWETSCLGYPVSDEYSWNSGRRSDFQRGYIHWTSTAGAMASCQ